MAKRLVIGDRVYAFSVGELIIIYDTSIVIDHIMLITTQIRIYSASRIIVLSDDTTGVDWTHKGASLSYPYEYVDTEPKLDVMNVMRQYGNICRPVPPAETPQPIENILNHVIYDCIY